MPSTYSTSLKLELIQNGEQSGVWGQTTNRNISLIEQAVSGVLPLTLTGGDYTLTNLDGIPDDARNAVINCSGLLGAPANIIAPSVQKTYIVTNNTGANVTIKTSTGNGVTVLNTTSSLVYCDGTNFFNAVTLNNVIGNQTISGSEVILGNVTSGGNLTVTSNVSSGAGNLTFTSNNGIVTAAVNTGAYTPPTGTSAQRPSAPNGGMSRFNTDVGAYEIFNGAVWQPITGAYAVNYLLVAGGGSGGSTRGGGGGGAGGMLSNTTSVQPGTSYVITVGAGGPGLFNDASNGSNSSIASTVIAVGGGGGGGNYGGVGNINGRNGGSGGGNNNDFDNQLPTGTVGAGTSGQGNSGFRSVFNSETGGGGGGAGVVGGTVSINGGIGLQNSLRTNSAVYYAGGGGGGTGSSEDPIGVGGLGGGGNGGPAGFEPAFPGFPGTPNTGGGGGGSGGTLGTPSTGGAGGSGICVLVYPSSTQRATGGTVTTYTSGGQTYWVHTFTTSGTFTA
jgi:hypothetical protein